MLYFRAHQGGETYKTPSIDFDLFFDRRTCSNGICTTSSGGEYSEVFENFVPEFFAGAKVVVLLCVVMAKISISD
jgi:hypothetical protein